LRRQGVVVVQDARFKGIFIAERDFSMLTDPTLSGYALSTDKQRLLYRGICQPQFYVMAHFSHAQFWIGRYRPTRLVLLSEVGV
jgi:hypothetical protein